MDNVTHSLVGAAIAQGAIQWRLRGTTSGQNVQDEVKTASIAALPMYVASIMANNFPDLDLLVTTVMDARLAYILHHRGHTHTLMFAPLQLLMILGIFGVYARWKKPDWTREDWKWFVGLGFFGCFVHIGMDSWNVYGVHPFWPLDNHWYYGDFVFILEPLIWMTVIPWLLTHTVQRWTRNLLIFFYSFGFVALSVAYFQTWWYPLLILTVGLSYGYVVRYKLSPKPQAFVSFTALIAMLSVLLTSSLWARAELTQSIVKQSPNEKVRDIALMSYPSNPFCYQFASMSFKDNNKTYILRRGTYSFLPKAFRCPQLLQGMTAPMKPSKQTLKTQTGGIQGKVLEFRRPIRELQHWVKANCKVKAAMQFIRAPYWKEGKKHIQIGDLRFDRRKGEDLAEFRLHKIAKACPTLLPPWVAPFSALGFW